MSKIATVQALDDTKPQRQEIRTVAALQEAVDRLATQMTHASQAMQDKLEASLQTLESWRQTVVEVQEDSSQQMLDLAVLLELLPQKLSAIEQRQDRIESQLAQLLAAVSALQPSTVQPAQPLTAGRSVADRIGAAGRAQLTR